jgi:hypothetical protein
VTSLSKGPTLKIAAKVDKGSGSGQAAEQSSRAEELKNCWVKEALAVKLQ